MNLSGGILNAGGKIGVNSLNLIEEWLVDLGYTPYVCRMLGRHVCLVGHRVVSCDHSDLVEIIVNNIRFTFYPYYMLDSNIELFVSTIGEQVEEDSILNRYTLDPADPSFFGQLEEILRDEQRRSD